MKENITKLLKNKYFYLGIFGFIFLIIIIMTFSGGKKPDESECESGKIRDAEGACDADGNNKTSICRENCEAVGGLRNKWDCKTKKCICRDDYKECGGICCPSSKCSSIEDVCCSPDSIINENTDSVSCCNAGKKPNSDKTECVMVCGETVDSPVCDNACIKIIQPTTEDIGNITHEIPTSQLSSDGSAIYYCDPEKLNPYTVSKYYPPSINNNYFCANNMSDSGDKYGFCSDKKEPYTEHCFPIQTKDTCENDTKCKWNNMLVGKDAMRSNWNLYTAQQNLAIPDYVANACGDTGVKFGVTTPAEGEDFKHAKYTDCIHATNNAETTYQQYNSTDKSCSYIMSCLKENTLKSSSKSNDRKIEKRDKGKDEWKPLISKILPEQLESSKSNDRKREKIDEWKYKKCLGNAEDCDYFTTHDEGTGGLPDSYGCDDGVIKKANYKTYVCNTTTLACELDKSCDSTNPLCISQDACSTCDKPPVGSLSYNTQYNKLYVDSINVVSGNNRSGDLFIAEHHNSRILAGTGDATFYCGEFMFIPYSTTVNSAIKRGDFFYIKFIAYNGYLRRGALHEDYGNLDVNRYIYGDEYLFSVSSIGDNKYIDIKERFTLKNKHTGYDITSLQITENNITAYCIAPDPEIQHSIDMDENIKFTSEGYNGWNYTLFRVVP